MQKHLGLQLRKESSYIFPLYYSSHNTPLISSWIIICIDFSVSFIAWSIGHRDILGQKGLQSPCLMQPEYNVCVELHRFQHLNVE